MADSPYEVVHNHFTTEASASLNASDWGYAVDTRRLIVQDGATKRFFWDSTRLADTTGTYGAAVLGVAGITGVTPNGGALGAGATAYNMMVGLRDYTDAAVSGTLNTVPIFTGAHSLGNSTLTYATGTFTHTFATAGTNAEIGVTHSDNTNGASNARVKVSVGGASGGDAVYRMQVTGVTDWTMGIDNSVSGDPWVLAASNTLGTSNVLSITTAGLITAVSDLTLSAAVIGSDISLRVSNTNNTNAASHARLNLLVGGSSAGDPFIRFDITGVMSWVIGSDNSVSGDPFVIAASGALGSSNVLSITSAGVMSASSRINTGGATDSSNFLLNVRGFGFASIAVSSSSSDGGAIYAFGVGQPSDFTGGNSEVLTLRHLGASLGAILEVDKTGTGSYRDLAVKNNGSTLMTFTAAGAVTCGVTATFSGTLNIPTSIPGSPVNGSMYWDGANNLLYVYNGTAWRYRSLNNT